MYAVVRHPRLSTAAAFERIALRPAALVLTYTAPRRQSSRSDETMDDARYIFTFARVLRCAQLLLLAAVVREQMISLKVAEGESWAHVPFKVPTLKPKFG